MYMKGILFLFLLLALLPASGQERYISLDGTQIRILTRGIENREKGQPLIVFESGHGTPMGNWDKALAGISPSVPLLAYDRPGIGGSDPIDEIPSLKNVSDGLLKILKHLELEPPYVLVGHSLGGVYVRGFAIYYPEMLAGLIIIDPADFTETHQNKRQYYEVLGWEDTKVDSLIESFIDKRNRRHAQAPGPIRREGQFLEELREREFLEIQNSKLPNIPVHMLTGGRFDLPDKYRSTVYDDELLFRAKMNHRISRWIDVVESVDKGMFFYSANAGHFVHIDDPELLISSIKIVLKDYEELQGKSQK